MVSLKIEIVELIGHRTNDIYLTSQIPPMTFVAFEQFFFGVIVYLALQLLSSGLNLKDPINNQYYVFPLWNAKDLAMRSKGNYNDWRNVMRYQLMIVDDLGTEPREVMEFGNVYTPLIDLITARYEEQLYTIFTTNLTPAQLEEKYGKRIVDRLNEMVEKVVFENESYRR